MGKRITLSDSDLRVLQLVLQWRITEFVPNGTKNAILGAERCQELLDKLTGES